MTLNRSSREFGKRLAKYRKLAGLSAQQLSERVGGVLSRSVIANIESGRKSEVTVDQLLALAWVLDIPPAVLALPAETPFSRVQVVDGEDLSVMSVYDLATWFSNSESLGELIPGERDVKQAANSLAPIMLVILERFSIAIRTLGHLEELSGRGGKVSSKQVDDLREGFVDILKDMRRAGMVVELSPEDARWEVRLDAIPVDGGGQADGDD